MEIKVLKVLRNEPEEVEIRCHEVTEEVKELIRDMLNTYFMLATMISFAMMILGVKYIPDAQFGYEAFKMPLIYAAYATLPNMVMYAKKELNMKQLLFRKIIQLLLVEIIVLQVAIPKRIYEAGEMEIVIALAFGAFCIFLLTHVVEWFMNMLQARKMTDDLMKFQEKMRMSKNKES